MGRNRRAKKASKNSCSSEARRIVVGHPIPSPGMIGATVDSGHSEESSVGDIPIYEDADLDKWYKLQSTQQKEEYFKEGLLVYAPFPGWGKSLLDSMLLTTNNQDTCSDKCLCVLPSFCQACIGEELDQSRRERKITSTRFSFLMATYLPKECLQRRSLAKTSITDSFPRDIFNEMIRLILKKLKKCQQLQTALGHLSPTSCLRKNQERHLLL